MAQAKAEHYHAFTLEEAQRGVALMRGWNTVADYARFVATLTELSERRWDGQQRQTILSLLRDGWGVALDYFFADLTQHPSYALLREGRRSAGPSVSLVEISQAQVQH
jgi:hypothetical protein